jgi:hypothetical protein
MPEPNLFQIFVSRMNQLSVTYMITGAVAGIIYGEPRLTNDIDMVIDLKADKIDPFSDSFPIEDFYCPPPEVIKLEISRPSRGHFNLIHHKTGFRADVYAAGKDELNLWGLKNRKAIDVEGDEFWLAPIEYVILRKLEYFQEGVSDKHLRDISGMLALSSDQIDFKVLNERIKKRQLEKEWRAAKNFTG